MSLSSLIAMASSSSAFIFSKNTHSKLASTLTLEMSKDYETVHVDLGDRSYPIYIGAEFDEVETGKMLANHVSGKRAFLITNDRIAPMYLNKYKEMLEAGGKQVDTLVLPDGEDKKTLNVLTNIFDKALELALDRRVTFVALGGSVWRRFHCDIEVWFNAKL